MKLNNYLFLILLLLSFSSFSHAQSWEKTFPSPITTGLAKGFDVMSTSDGNYVIVGELDLPTGAIRHYIWLIKIDTEGNELWSKVYNSTDIAHHSGKAIAETINGDLLIAGFNGNKASVFKTNADGDSLWIKDFGGDGENLFRDIIRMENGNFILTGQYEETPNSGQKKAWGVGMTSDGDTLWTNRFFETTPFQSSAYQVSKLPLNHYLISGTSQNQGFTIKLDPLSPYQVIWGNIYQVSTEDKLFACSAINTDDSSLLLAGSSLGFASYMPIILKVDADDGGFQNEIPSTAVFSGAITDIIPTMDNGFLYTGSSFDFWNQSFDDVGFITKMNADFEIEWEMIYTDSLDKQGASVHQTSDGSYLIAGSRQNGMFLKKIGGSTNPTSNLLSQQITVNLFPNPSSKILNIETPEELFNKTISIDFFDSNGKLVLHSNIDQSLTQINITSLSIGTYFYKIKNNTQYISTGKVIIQ